MSHDPFSTIKNFPKKWIEKLRWKKGLNLIRIWCSSPYFYIILSLLVFNIRVLHSLSNCPFERDRESYTTFLSSLSLSHFHINERRLFSSISSPYLSVESFLKLGIIVAIPLIQGDLAACGWWLNLQISQLDEEMTQCNKLW